MHPRQMAHQAKLMPYKKLIVFLGISITACFSIMSQEAEEIEYILHLPPEFSM